MYVRTIVADLIPGREKQAVQIFREQIVPAIRTQPGYLGTAIYIDHASRQAQTVSYWTTRQACEATSQGSDYLGRVTGMLRSCLVNREFVMWEVGHLDVVGEGLRFGEPPAA